MLESESVQRVVVVDYGGQYTHLIAKRVRGLGLFSQIAHPETFDPSAEPDLVGVVLSGGPSSVYDEGAPQLHFDPSALSVPILGLCYGHQLLARAVGGQVIGHGAGEYGMARASCDADATLFAGLDRDQSVWMSHRDRVAELPTGFRVTASSDSLPIAGFESPDARIFGLQFHPEVTHTPNGLGMLDNFLSRCTERRDWNPGSYAEMLTEQTRLAAGSKELLLLISGGVDSLVTMALCARAVGQARVHAVHVDTGLMRLDESDSVVAFLKEQGIQNLHLIRAEDRFLGELEGKIEPEIKRAIIGRLFVEVTDDAVRDLGLGDDWLLVQGTIYPDSIESGATEKAAVIKTHHNRVAEIQRLIAEGKVLEPILDLYKNEVRDLGTELGLPEHLVNRHPFPGPGLGIRYLGSDTDEPEAGFDVEQSLADGIAAGYGLHAAVLPIRSVGVQGDARTYQHPVALWWREGNDHDWDALADCAAEVVNRLKTLNRAVFAPSGLDPRRLSLGATCQAKPELDRLRLVDHATQELTDECQGIWQMPVVALPLFDADGQQAYVMRPVCSRDAMTADFFRMQPERMGRIVAAVADIPAAGEMFYDVTTKPPGTIEWE